MPALCSHPFLQQILAASVHMQSALSVYRIQTSMLPARTQCPSSHPAICTACTQGPSSHQPYARRAAPCCENVAPGAVLGRSRCRDPHRLWPPRQSHSHQPADLPQRAHSGAQRPTQPNAPPRCACSAELSHSPRWLFLGGNHLPSNAIRIFSQGLSNPTGLLPSPEWPTFA